VTSAADKQRELIEASVSAKVADARQYLAYSSPGPLPVDRAELFYLWDVYNNKYLDLCAADGAILVGHNHPKINGAVTDHVGHYHNTNATQGNHLHWPAISYAKALAETFDITLQVAFAADEYSAMREALRLACEHSGSGQFLTVGGDHLWLVTDYAARAHWIAPGKMIYKEDWEPYGALVISLMTVYAEPLDHYWVQCLIDGAQRAKVPVIVNEARTGYGRTGRMWAQQRWSLDADLTVLGGGGGGGFPFGAVLARPVFFDAPSALAPLSADTVVCQAGLAVLENLTPILLEHVDEAGHVLSEALDEVQLQFPDIFVRHWGEGLLRGMELRDELTAIRFASDCLAQGLIIGEPRGKVVVLSPILSINENELRRAVDVMASVFLAWTDDV